MKIRTDFVTNSSSSSFCVALNFNLKNGKQVSFEGNGATGESGTIDYFMYDAVVTVSPKQLGMSKNLDELISRLTDGFVDRLYEDSRNIFAKSEMIVNDYGEENDAYTFVESIKENISKIDDLESITLEITEEGYYDSYVRKYTYDLFSGRYYGVEMGEPFESEGEGGYLELTDLDECEIKNS